MVREDILTKLKKLMAHEESARSIGSFEEAEAFAGKINELLIRHKISMSEVESHVGVDNDSLGETRYEHAPNVKKSRIWWRDSLASIVSRAHFCRILYSRRGNMMWWVGRESDRQVCVMMYEYLAREIRLAADRGSREAAKKEGITVARWRTGFLRGALTSLRERFENTRRGIEKEEGNTSTALVLVRAEKEVDEFLHQTHPHIKGRNLRNPWGNMEGYGQGVEFGKTVPLRKGVGSSTKGSLEG